MPSISTTPPPSVVQKLTAPTATLLSAAASRECLVGCIHHGKRTIATRANGKRLVVVLGNTGAGKSAFVNLLHGCTFAYEDDDKMLVRADSPVPELMRIGHSKTSETFAPQVEDASASVGAGVAFVDCPGFLDNRGFEINVANAVNTKHTVAAATSAVVVVVVNYYSLRADRGKGLHDLLSILLGLFGSVESVKAHAPSVLLAISHAPVTHPETGDAMSLHRIRRSLLDPSSGLDEQTAEVLRALLQQEGHILLFHLLGRGDASWLSRAQLLERVRQLAPIDSPTSLFQSVLSSSDKEKLRTLVAALGGEVRGCLSEGTPSACEDAAVRVSELLELRLIEHGFVEALVESEVRSAIEEQMAAVDGLIEGLYLEGGGGSGGDGGAMEAAADAQRLAEARKALKHVRAMLDAFSAIEVVRGLLQALIDEAALKLSNAEKLRAEAQGRMEMSATLQEALRSIGSHQLGADYNVVREVLVLPGLRAAAEEEQRRRQHEMSLAHAAELASSSSSSHAESEARERHESALREHALRSAAANAAWASHLQLAEEKLQARDAALLANDGPSFFATAGTTRERLCAAAAFVNLSRKALTPHDVDVAATLLRTLPPLAEVKALVLSGNPFGDAGISAIADAGSHGALSCLERLFLDGVSLSDAGLGELARALANGALPRLGFVDLTRNLIGDRGVAALADAFRSGAGTLAQSLRTLYLYNNKVGSPGVAALVEALSSLERPAALETLYLDNNQIREDGMAALCAAIDAGRVPSLASLHLSGNPVGADAVDKAVQAVQRQAEAAGAAPRLRPTPQTRDIEAPPVE